MAALRDIEKCEHLQLSPFPLSHDWQENYSLKANLAITGFSVQTLEVRGSVYTVLAGSCPCLVTLNPHPPSLVEEWVGQAEEGGHTNLWCS